MKARKLNILVSWHGNLSCLHYFESALWNMASALHIHSTPRMMTKTVDGWSCGATVLAPVLSMSFWCQQICSYCWWSASKFWQPKPQLHVRDGKEEDQMEEIWVLLVQSPCRMLLVLVVLDLVVSYSTIDDKIAKSVDEVQDFVYLVQENSLKQKVNLHLF